jgi:tRNA G18 (ribose-2'-O)-methylase SpoU
MKYQVHRKTVTDRIHKQRVQSVAGTMAIEGLTLSEASRRNLDRYASGQANFQQIMAELKAKYQRAE